MHSTRRRALQVGVALATAGLAGCSSAPSSSASPTPTPTPTSTSTPTARPESTEGTPSTATSRSVDLPTADGATLRTTMGDVTVDLYPDLVPLTVGNFVGLATGELAWRDPETGEVRDDPLYADVPFHRVIDDFMIQGGDPTGTGRGGPGYTFDDEFHPDLTHDSAGVLSMANRGPDTNGSQFFVTLDAQPHLDGRHAVFGNVVDGMDVVEAIGTVATDENDRPLDPVLLESVAVER
jgi:peptidyl-prolyl cis-trans isomerase A (cyclophilin A)